MLPANIVGKTGRALTAVGSDGQVEIGGLTYAAVTYRTPVRAGDEVEVTGWRLVGESSHVLSVCLPGDTSLAGPSRIETHPGSPSSPPGSAERGGTRLVKCLACGRQISSAAEACPQCGHPNKTAGPASVGPRCYACPAQATTLCQSCGEMSCVIHLQSVYIHHGADHGGGYELRCEPCRSSYKTWSIVAGVIAVFVFILLASTFGRR
jgi:hypothetical protein